MSRQRRRGDALRAVEGLLHSQIAQPTLDGRALASLAATMATEYTEARRGTLLLDVGGALQPVLALGPELTPAPADRTAFDAELVETARAGRAAATAGGELAVPVVSADRVLGALYLEFDEPPPGAIRELAEAVADRIASVLRSAELVATLSRQSRNLEILQSLSGCLSAGRLGSEQLLEAQEAAILATTSQESILALFAADEGFEEVLVRGDEERLRALAHRAAATGAVPEPETTLLGTLHRQLDASEPAGRPAGLLLVRRLEPKPYDHTDRQFFGALTHLLSGALERRDYFRRAAEDPVTGTGSRLALQLTLTQLQHGADRSGEPFSIVLADIDRFKEINDVHGHPEGDRVLRRLAAIFRERLRDQDFLARYGGDEFVLLLPATDAEGAHELATDLCQRVAARPLLPGGESISVSMGVASYPRHAAAVHELLASSDRALYASKQAGRDRVTLAEGA